MKSKGVLVKYEQMLTFICNKHHLHEVTIICTRYTRYKKKLKKYKKNPYLPPYTFWPCHQKHTIFFFWPYRTATTNIISSSLGLLVLMLPFTLMLLFFCSRHLIGLPS